MFLKYTRLYDLHLYKDIKIVLFFMVARLIRLNLMGKESQYIETEIFKKAKAAIKNNDIAAYKYFQGGVSFLFYE